MTGALFGGAALGLVGNFMQAQAQKSSEERAYNNQRNMRLGNIPLLLALAGGSNASTLGKSLLGRDEADYIFGTNPQITAQQQARVAEIQARLGQLGQGRGSGWMGARREGQTARDADAATAKEREMLNHELDQLVGSIKNVQPGIVNSAELDAAAKLLPGAQYEKIAEQERQAGLGQLGRYDTETENMLRMLNGFGDAEKERIRMESERDLKAANRAASLRMSRAGAGASTLLSGAQAQNSGQIGERRNNAITGINSGVLQQRLGIMGQRSGQRMGLETGLNQQNLNLRTAPLNQQTAILANIGQSGLGGNSFQPIGGVSPIGTGLQTAGNTLAMYGGLQSLKGQGRGGGGSGSSWGSWGPDANDEAFPYTQPSSIWN